MTIGLGRNGTGVLRLVRPGVYLHFCPACKVGHTFDIHALSRDGHVLGFDGDFVRPSVGEPVRHESEGQVCEYVLRGGVLYFMESCTHELRGKSRHLIEYPL
jgi:hypothetical protein